MGQAACRKRMDATAARAGSPRFAERAAFQARSCAAENGFLAPLSIARCPSGYRAECYLCPFEFAPVLIHLDGAGLPAPARAGCNQTPGVIGSRASARECAMKPRRQAKRRGSPFSACLQQRALAEDGAEVHRHRQARRTQGWLTMLMAVPDRRQLPSRRARPWTRPAGSGPFQPAAVHLAFESLSMLWRHGTKARRRTLQTTCE